MKKQCPIRPFDIILTILAIVLIVLSIKGIRQDKKNEPMLVITSPDSQYVYPLSKEGLYTIKGQLGDSIIKVSGGKAFFLESPCPNKVCMQSHPIHNNGDWSACLPNGIFLRIESKESEYDGLAW